MMKRLLGLVLTPVLIAGSLIGLTATPALADGATIKSSGFGPFNSATDCGPSVYLTTLSLKAWACAWNSESYGGVKTGIAVQNYGVDIRTVDVYWERWDYYDESTKATEEAVNTTPTPVAVAPNTTVVFWATHLYSGVEYLCNDNEGCYYQGAKGHITANGLSSASSYSPLQSPLIACVDGPKPVTNWADTGKC
jgi:hypothetical protein